MQRAITPLLVLLFITDMYVFHLVCHAEDKPSEDHFIGFAPVINGKEDRYELFFVFGVEQWEGSRKLDYTYQTWDLNCEYPDRSGTKKTECRLHRQIIILFGDA